LLGITDAALSGTNDTLIGANAGHDTLMASGSGSVIEAAGTGNTLIGGSGTVTLTASGDADTLAAGSGTTTMVDSGASGFYQFGTGDAQAIIFNGAASNTSASNELDFAPGISDQQLWLLRSGNSLQIDLLGTASEVTISNWYAATGNQLQEITAGGLKLDSQVAQLVQAMAVYSSGNPGFNPTAVAQIPNDPALQSAVASAWHS